MSVKDALPPNNSFIPNVYSTSLNSNLAKNSSPAVTTSHRRAVRVQHVTGEYIETGGSFSH
eukprot:8287793-Pyramimonas_sp.AAC.1